MVPVAGAASRLARESEPAAASEAAYYTTSEAAHAAEFASRLIPQSRRVALLGVAATAAAVAPGNLEARAIPKIGFAETPNDLVGKGMDAFRKADVKADVDESIRLFNSAAQLGYPRSLLWQRGLSLYYAEKFSEGSKQFRGDVAANPNDTEEAIWAMLCEARLNGFETAQKNMLKVGKDPRPVMRVAEALFRGTGSAEQLEEAGGRSPSDQFYSLLYRGLYAEAEGETAAAERYITEAAATSYGRKSQDYMAKLAQVHVKLRGWPEK